MREQVNFNLEKNIIVIIFAMYTLSFGLLLFNNGVFFDDWVFYGVDTTITREAMGQLGHMWVGYLYASFKDNVFLYRSMTFACYLISALFLNSILKTIREIDITSRMFIVLFFTLFPVNSARIAICHIHYAVSYVMFFCGIWIVSKYLVIKNILLRIFSLLVFFVSFAMYSLLVFYITVPLYILYMEKQNIKSISGFVMKILEYKDFLILPILFWVIKQIYFVPYGVYKDVYIITSIMNIRNLILTFRTSFLEILSKSAQSITPLELPVLVIVFFIISIILKRNTIDKTKSKTFSCLFLLGLFFFLTAVYAYLSTNRIPKMGDMDSRHQILIPPGASIILISSLGIFFNILRINIKGRIFIYSILVVMFSKLNILSYLDFQKDWYKQCSLIENFKTNSVIRNNTTFLFKDNTYGLNANMRYYRFYEYSGLMKLAFGEETRYGADTEINPYHYRCFNTRYSLRDYKPKKTEYKILIDFRTDRGLLSVIDNKKVLELMFYEYFKPEKFKTEVKKLIELKTEKIT
ncbi:hypothetical protein KKA69_05905 [Patescibacteria group bacterium]|nr:hypothetical protein [Patescibacteria group bacterium]